MTMRRSVGMFLVPAGRERGLADPAARWANAIVALRADVNELGNAFYRRAAEAAAESREIEGQHALCAFPALQRVLIDEKVLRDESILDARARRKAAAALAALETRMPPGRILARAARQIVCGAPDEAAEGRALRELLAATRDLLTDEREGALAIAVLDEAAPRPAAQATTPDDPEGGARAQARLRELEERSLARKRRNRDRSE